MSKSTLFSQNRLLRSHGRLLDLTEPKVMAIVNLSQDSFYNPGKRKPYDALGAVEQAFHEGAAIIDLGAASSRPGADEVPLEQEWKLLAPVLKAVKAQFPNAWISVDTFHAEIARRSLGEGCDLINDISAGMHDENMLEVMASASVPYIVMHMRGTPRTMSQMNQYQDIVTEVTQYLQHRINACRKMGVYDIIVDPGFGFAKVNAQNFELLAGLSSLLTLECPVMIGISRKSSISSLLKTDAAGALNGSTAFHMLALNKGASLLRVHDTLAAVQAIKIFENYALNQ